jgi:hypothetical protein
VNRQQLLQRIERSWSDFKASYADLPRAQWTKPGVTRQWSVRDILAHVTTWEEETLKHLPTLARGQRPPLYSTTYGGLDAFNARKTEEKRGLSLAEVTRQQDAVHERLLAYVRRAPEALIERETRFRRRLRVDTYGHYPHHAKAIRAWRQRRGL